LVGEDGNRFFLSVGTGMKHRCIEKRGFFFAITNMNSPGTSGNIKR
jgi:hypothetical protein